MTEVKPEEVAWTRNLWLSLRDGGQWAVPRSGLIFRKEAQSTSMVLALRMPWSEELAEAHRQGANVPPTKEAFEKYQQEDFEEIAARFVAGGIKVRDESKT